MVSLGLYQRFRSPVPIGLYLMLLCCLSFIGAQLLRERSRQDVAIEYDDKARPVPGAIAGA